MKTLYLDCGMGAAGDMLAASLLELLPDPDAFVAELNALGIPGVHIERQPAVKCGITGTHLAVTVHGEEEESHDHHSHGHAHEPHVHDAHSHTHHHGSLHHIEHLVREHLPLPAKVRDDIMAVYGLIAEAESHAHGVPVTEIHFHEVGTMDAVADITAVCLLMDRLAPEKVVVSPVHVGSGQVRCAHGILPVPAPATAWILRDAPIYGGTIQGELCTPTGAALLRHFADGFGAMPIMRVSQIGYGCGKKDFEAANCVRAMLGETEDAVDAVVTLCCNLDDMTPESVGFAMECLLEAGALDVYTVPAGMKKNRPGLLLYTLCRPEDRERLVRGIFRHTSTLGIRESVSRRYVLSRQMETVQTACGPIRRKISGGYGVKRIKYEYEDLARIAREQGSSLEEIRKAIPQETENP